MRNNHDLEHEFFKKVKGWEKLRTGMWVSPDKYYRNGVPPISKSWDAFHEWVVPELVEKLNSTGIKDCRFRDAYDRSAKEIGGYIMQWDSPQRALEWAMEELGR